LLDRALKQEVSMRSPFPALLTVLFVAGAQSAYVWEELASGDGETISYNPLTVRRDGAVVNVLQKVAFSSPFTTSNGVSASFFTSHLAINCEANTVTRSNYTAYDASDNAIAGATDQAPQGTVPIDPESGASMFKDKLCS
jgi:hypothetical protein